MTKIQKKIIHLSISILFIMGSFWFLTSYLTEQSTKKYKEIVENYLLINNISTLSSQSYESLSTLLNDPTEENELKYYQEKEKLLNLTEQLTKVEDKHNTIELTNYKNLVKNQVEAMELTLQFSKTGMTSSETKYHEESLKISQFIDEATLDLFKQQLTNQEKLYVTMMNMSENLRRLGIWTLILVFYLSLLFSYWFSKGITRSISQLTSAVKEISAGNLDQSIQLDSKEDDEISYLSKAFDDMRGNIKQYIAEIKNKSKLEKELQENQLLLKESELNRLQHQINPHFLFNTLNMLSKKAYLEGANETSDLIASVSSVLRYNLNSYSRTVQLKDEIALLKEYLIILKARFTSRIDYKIIEEYTNETIKIPCFILQPLVENSFTHGIEPRENGGYIHIFIKQLTEFIEIDVIDNGVGIESDRLIEIIDFKNDSNGETTGIGLSNVRKRLELHYGRKDLFSITSIHGIGTHIKLTIPLKEEE